MVICKKICLFWTIFWDFLPFLVWPLWLFVKLRGPVTCDRRIDLIATVLPVSLADTYTRSTTNRTPLVRTSATIKIKKFRIKNIKISHIHINEPIHNQTIWPYHLQVKRKTRSLPLSNDLWHNIDETSLNLYTGISPKQDHDCRQKTYNRKFDFF